MSRIDNSKMIILELILAILLVFITSKTVQAVEFGGKLETSSGLSYFEDDVGAEFSGYSEIEVFLPSSATVEPRLVMQGELKNGGANLGIKYLYLRHRLEQGHLTAGRQPVSWSYGAMLNLLDYGLGVEDLAEQSITPGIDGFKGRYRLGEGRSLEVVTSFPEFEVDDYKDLGYGARLRFPGSGYDLSFNLAYQPVELGERDNLLRIGSTYNSELADLGVYGSLGYFRLEDKADDDIILQLGLDYSWRLGEYNDRQVILQTEYFRFLKEELDLGVMAGINQEFDPATNLSGQDLLTTNVSLQLDAFSTVGTTLMAEFDENSIVLAPYYLTDLGGGLEFRVDGNVIRDDEGDFNPGVSTKFSYYF